ncbi:MAG: ATP-binding protein [Dehalococcoidia bacterium]
MRPIHLLALVALSAVWGASFMFIKIMVGEMSPIAVGWLRLAGGTALIAVVAGATGRRLPRSKNYWRGALVVAALGGAIPLVVIPWGQREIPSNLGAVLNGAMPFWVAILATIFLPAERVTLTKALGVLIGFAGLALIIGPDALDLRAGSTQGQLAIVGATACYAGAAVFTRRTMLGVDSTILAGMQNGLGFLMLTPLLLLAGLAVLLLAVGVAIWLARRLTRPIRELERAAGQLASGDLSGRADVPPGTDVDLAALGDTLNAMAAQLEESRGSQRAFLLSISHDLRTPLTSIRGYAEALADGTLDEADPDGRKRAATVISSEARRLERLVGDLLDLSRLDSRQFSLSARDCDAAEVVHDVAMAFYPQARDLGLQLRVVPGDPAPAHLDADRLGQIVADLMENALKYATSSVEVSTEVHDGEVAVAVIDDGPGIPPADMDKVFTRLYTVRATPGRAVGTGLGLAIVQELAVAMRGHAVADAPAAGGARITVTLPAR